MECLRVGATAHESEMYLVVFREQPDSKATEARFVNEWARMDELEPSIERSNDRGASNPKLVPV